MSKREEMTKRFVLETTSIVLDFWLKVLDKVDLQKVIELYEERKKDPKP